jgi:ubiquinone/menaquinone biosynthesis C-methylase UbiE
MKFDWGGVWQRKALEKSYDLKAINGWEKVNISSSFVVQTIKKRLNLTSEDHLLELGSGSGFLTKYFLQETKNYMGSDKSKNMVNLAKSIFDCEFINCEASNLPFDDNQFDYVVAYSVFQYFPSHKYVQKTIAEMNRISKKGIYIGDLPVYSHEKNHMLYRREQFSDWLKCESAYTNNRFDVWKIKNE